MQFKSVSNINKKDMDLELWKQYKQTKSNIVRDKLLARLDGIIQNYVNKWVGTINRSILYSKAKILAIKSFDTYDPNKGTALATHVTNSLAPLSRVVYTYSNTARLPENITLKVNSYNQAKDYLVNTLGRDPTVDELHQELGWKAKDINRMESYFHRDLTESVGEVGDDFFKSFDDEDISTLSAIYYDLTPNEKLLFRHTTGFMGGKKMNNTELTKLLGISQAQLSYQKTLLTNKVKQITGKK